MRRILTLIRRGRSFLSKRKREFCVFSRIFIIQMRLNHMVKRLFGVHPVRVAFLVVYDSAFPLERLFSLMLLDSSFEPEIIVIPDIARGKDYMSKVFQKTYENLHKKYGERVIDSRNGNDFVDYSGKYDLYTTMNPYSAMTHKFYSIPYMASKGCPVFLVRYFYDTGTVYSNTFNRLTELSYLWRFYAQNPQDKIAVKEKQMLLHLFGRIRAIGTPKMDGIVQFPMRQKARKCVIIAPHHSLDPIGEDGFSIGNFDRYASFIASLPARYPQIDWIFRPHPLTMRTMVLSKRWTQAQADCFIRDITAFRNVEYQSGGEYWNTFARADALIQDCSSFLPEWFYTGKPQCFVLRDKLAENRQFLDFGKQLLSHVYKAYNQDDIVGFIDNVVLAGSDFMERDRRAFARTLMYNHPHASEVLLGDIKRCLKILND